MGASRCPGTNRRPRVRNGHSGAASVGFGDELGLGLADASASIRGRNLGKMATEIFEVTDG